MFPNTHFPQRIYCRLHILHGGDQEGRQAQNRGIVFTYFIAKLLGAVICAHVDHIKPSALDPHSYEVLANIVQITFDSAYDHFAG